MSTTTEASSLLNLQELVSRIERQQEETRKFVAEGHKLQAEAAKLNAEAAKFRRDTLLAPLAITVALAAGVATLVSIGLKAFGVTS